MQRTLLVCTLPLPPVHYFYAEQLVYAVLAAASAV